jgi:hypothetical protein
LAFLAVAELVEVPFVVPVLETEAPEAPGCLDPMGGEPALVA